VLKLNQMFSVIGGTKEFCERFLELAQHINVNIVVSSLAFFSDRKKNSRSLVLERRI
jgi:hypothetical protein